MSCSEPKDGAAAASALQGFSLETWTLFAFSAQYSQKTPWNERDVLPQHKWPNAQATRGGTSGRYKFEGGTSTRVCTVFDKLTHSRPLPYCWGTLSAKYRACSPPRDMKAAQIIRCFPPSFLLSLMALGGIQTKTLPWLAQSLAALSITEAACS